MLRDRQIPRRLLFSAGATMFGMVNLPASLRGAAPAGIFKSEGGLLEADIQAVEVRAAYIQILLHYSAAAGEAAIGITKRVLRIERE